MHEHARGLSGERPLATSAGASPRRAPRSWRARVAIATILGVLAAAPARSSAAFGPGEESILDVRYLGMPAGEARMVVGRPEGIVWPLVFQARTGGMVGFLDIREHLATYWDASTGLPRGSDLRALEVGDRHSDSARFDRTRGEATVTTERKGRRKIRTVPVPPDVHDLTSAFVALRLRRLEVGARHELPVLTGTHQFTLVADVVGRERVATPAGTFPCVKVKVRTALQGKFETKRDTFLWISEDADRVLARLEADFAVGTIAATLKRYHPGQDPGPLPTAAPDDARAALPR
jgi:hypothetical protein